MRSTAFLFPNPVIIVVLVLVLALAACGSPEPEESAAPEAPTGDQQAHLGNWAGVILGQGNVTLVLEEGGRFAMKVEETGREVSGQFQVDYQADPVALDLHGDGRVIAMIAEFPGSGAMRLKGTANPQLERPTDFSEEPGMMIMQLRRED